MWTAQSFQQRCYLRIEYLRDCSTILVLTLPPHLLSGFHYSLLSVISKGKEVLSFTFFSESKKIFSLAVLRRKSSHPKIMQ